MNQMGRGLEDFSHLFVSQEGGDEAPSLKRIVCLLSPPGELEKPFLAANLALALAQEGKRVGVLGADLQFPPLTHLLGQLHSQVKLLQILMPPSPSILQGIEEMGKGTDILFIDAPQFSSPLTQIILELVGEAIIILPVELKGRIDGYQLIKSIHLFKGDLRVGLVITKACTAQEARTTFELTRAIAERHLGMELKDYGYLLNDLNILQSIKGGTPIISSISYPRLKRSVLRIANLILQVKKGGDNDFCKKFKVALKESNLGYRK